jgi:hypothetical protein
MLSVLASISPSSLAAESGYSMHDFALELIVREFVARDQFHAETITRAAKAASCPDVGVFVSEGRMFMVVSFPSYSAIPTQ